MIPAIRQIIHLTKKVKANFMALKKYEYSTNISARSLKSICIRNLQESYKIFHIILAKLIDRIKKSKNLLYSISNPLVGVVVKVCN